MRSAAVMGRAGRPMDWFGAAPDVAETLAASVRAERSGRGVVLVDRPAEDVDAFDPPNLRKADRRRLAVGGGHGEVDAPVRPGVVVVPHIAGQHPLEVSTVPDQQPVQALGPHGAHPALGECVGPRIQLHRMRRIGSDVSG